MNAQLRAPIALKSIEGIVQQIDRLSRTVVLATSARTLQFIVPPACTVWLRGELSTLHLLQLRDRISLKYTDTPHGATAQVIEIDYRGTLRVEDQQRLAR